jgi:hypothetical protein
MLRAFLLGFIEFRSGFGRTYGDPFTPKSAAYDSGRELAHRLTLRRFEEKGI